jgi:hypothetical protein
MTDTDLAPQLKITVDFRPGRWGRLFHVFDLDNREIVLHQKDALRVAQQIIKIVKERRK